MGSTPVSKLDTDDSIKASYTHPGDSVSIDCFKSSLKGRNLNLFGRPSSEQYVGGYIFVYHTYEYLYVEHQLGFSSYETI